jgi:hypothetical protein
VATLTKMLNELRRLVASHASLQSGHGVGWRIAASHHRIIVIDPECDTCTKPSSSPHVTAHTFDCLAGHPGARHPESHHTRAIARQTAL